jgi:hypothetical protein
MPTIPKTKMVTMTPMRKFSFFALAGVNCVGLGVDAPHSEHADASPKTEAPQLLQNTPEFL